MFLAAGCTSGYFWLRSRIAVAVYRNRLDELSTSYESLRGRYNEAVSKTAVTELVVRDGKLSVNIRTIEGVVRSLPAPFDPAGEIYVDYVVIAERLWIRRIFDDKTPPSQGMLIDPELANLKWDMESMPCGKAVYRRLEEGRWLITVTGDGALGLAKIADDAGVILAAAPPVRDYSKIHARIRRELDAISPWEMICGLFKRPVKQPLVNTNRN